jgi:hypothetical protein
MAPISAVELTTDDFGRWARHARLVFPVPLNAGYAARIDLDWDELLAASEERIEVTNALERADERQPPLVREMLRYAARLVTEADLAVYAVRTDAFGSETLAMGLSCGKDGLVVVDTPTTARLVRTSATGLASAVVAAMPALRGFALEPIRLSERALEAIHAGASATGLDRSARNAAAAAGIPVEVVETLARLQEATAGGGLIGAVRYDADGTPIPAPLSSDWYEGPTGAVLKRNLGDGTVVYEPATRTAMTSAAVAAVSSVAVSTAAR